MMLTEQTVVPEEALPLAEMRAHLRLGTGFADDAAQDAILESHLRAALAAIEGRTAKILLAREFLWQLEAWRELDEQALPVAPVIAVASVTMRDRDGVASVIDPGRWRLVKDAHRPRIVATGAMLAGIPPGGVAEIAFTAGFGAAWAEVPVDLRQAVLLLAAQYHERRHEAGAGAGASGAMPFGVMALIERWRTVRVLGGRSSGGRPFGVRP